jgi:4-amino-4-deoxy-L-arabinose transferase-like glycosyltransferase
VNSAVKRSKMQDSESLISKPKHHGLSWLLWLFCICALFYNLGGAALFEPDEGRNAEKAREILLLDDWVTPHENFVPVLDKPIFYYWLVAFSFTIFGISEWSARLPSVLAAIGSIAVVYRFSRIQLGRWESLWSPLVLVTALEFFLLSRIVILDMTLTFFVTVALYSFYFAANAESESARKFHCLLMYVALAIGTLVKGLIGLILPGMVYFFYLLFAQKWSVLKKMYLVPGALIYISVVAPWYLWNNHRNPGYLRYYFWDEHFVRYLTEEFNRSEKWYYFLLVLGVGFLPWTLLSPLSVRHLFKNFDDKNLFLTLWASLPVLFFSLSASKLPHYILPTFPALAMITARAVVDTHDRAPVKRLWLMYLPLFFSGIMTWYFVAGAVSARLLPREIRTAVGENEWFVVTCAALLLILCGAQLFANIKGYGKSRSAIYLSNSAGLAILFILMGQLMARAAPDRSAKSLARASAGYVTPESQVVFYDTYRTGLIYYLRLNRPIWVVSRRGKSNLLGSPYVSMYLPDPVPGYGKVLYDFDAFRDAWRKSKKPLLVFLKAKHLARFEGQVGVNVRELAKLNDFILVAEQ